VADLVCEWGAFGLRLAKASRVLAVDADRPAIAALEAATRGAPGLKPLISRAHDLMRDPLTAPELKGITGSVLIRRAPVLLHRQRNWRRPGPSRQL